MPRGAVFGEEGGGLVLGADSRFYVDHAEPLGILEAVWPRWPLGDLPDGYEFLLLLQPGAPPR